MNTKIQTVIPATATITYCPKMWARGAERGGITRPHASGGKRYGRAAIEKAKGAAMLCARMEGPSARTAKEFNAPTVLELVALREAQALQLEAIVNQEWAALLTQLGLAAE